MPVNPHLSSGVFSQKMWPGVGDVDDCWCLADLMAVHAVAPWASLPDITKYRAAAGNPDKPGPTGGNIAHSTKAIRALYPKLAIFTSTANAGPLTWAAFASKMKTGNRRAASLSVLSSALPPSLTFGFYGTHRVTVTYTGKWRIANPLAQPHARWSVISEADLKRAVQAYPGDYVGCVLLPTVEKAFMTHPLYGG